MFMSMNITCIIIPSPLSGRSEAEGRKEPIVLAIKSFYPPGPVLASYATSAIEPGSELDAARLSCPHRLCAMNILLEMISRGWENFSRAAEWLFRLAVLCAADDGELVGPARRNSGREGWAAGLSVGDTNRPREASAVTPRGLAGSDDSIPIGHRSRLHLSAYDDRVRLPAGAAIYGDRAGAGPIRLVAWTIQSPRSAVLARRSVAAGVRSARSNKFIH
jgi:hypothetical protein